MPAKDNNIAKIKGILQRIFADPASAPADQGTSGVEQAQQLELSRVVSLIDPRSYFNKAMLVWNIAIFSLPIDLFFVSRQGSALSNQADLLYVIYALTALALLGLNPESVMSWVDQLRAKPGESSNSWMRTILPVALLLVLAFGKALYHLSALGLAPILIALGLIAIALPKHIQTFKTMRDSFTRLTRNPVLLIQQINFQVLLVIILPIICARLISVVAALNTHLGADGFDHYLAFSLISMILLLRTKPTASIFSTKCLRCAAWTPRAVRYLGYCPACSFESFLPKLEEQHELQEAEQSQLSGDYTNRERKRAQKPKVVDAAWVLKELLSKLGSKNSKSSDRKLPHKTLPEGVDTTSSTNKS